MYLVHQINPLMMNVWGIKLWYYGLALYESLKNFMIIPILLFVKSSRNHIRGRPTAHFVLWYGLLRIFTDVFREYGAGFFGIGRGQYFNILMALAGLVMMVWTAQKSDTPCVTDKRKKTLSQTGIFGLYLRRLVFVTLLLFSLTIPSSWSQGALKRIRKEVSRSVSSKGDYVILLHGMGRTHRSMKRIKRSLSKEGYEVVNLRYPSKKESIEDLVKTLDEKVKAKCTDTSRSINFVTHSLGGILVRCYLRDHKDLNVGRVVMLCPPNSGSEIVDALRGIRLFGIVTGPTGQRLGTETNDLPNTLGPVDFELGVITGDRSLNPLYSGLINGPDDGKISVESAKVAGMQDFLVVHYSHTFIMLRKGVIEQVIHFLKHGEFRKGVINDQLPVVPGMNQIRI